MTEITPKRRREEFSVRSLGLGTDQALKEHPAIASLLEMTTMLRILRQPGKLTDGEKRREAEERVGKLAFGIVHSHEQDQAKVTTLIGVIRQTNVGLAEDIISQLDTARKLPDE